MADSSYLRSLRDGATEGQVPTFSTVTSRFELNFPSGYNPAPAIVDLYVTTTGDDFLGDGSQANPFATPTRAAAAIGPHGLARVHMASGTYSSPRLRSLKGPVVFVGDGAGQPGDDGLTVELAPAAAGVGTGASTIVGVFAPGAFDGFAIQMLSGAAIGQRRTIVETTATDLIPIRDFDPAPAAGDSYRVVSPAIIWDSFFSGDRFIQDCGSPMPQSPLALSIMGPFQLGGYQEALHLVNVRFDNGGGGSTLIVNSHVALWGCDTTNLQLEVHGGSIYAGSDNRFNGLALQIRELLNLNTFQTYAGYTYASLIGPPSPGLQLIGATGFGYFFVPDSVISVLAASHLQMLGGRLLFLVLLHGSNGTLQLVETTISRIGGDVVGIECSTGSQLTVDGGVEITGTARGLRLFEGGEAYAAGSAVVTSAGDAADMSQGGKLFIRGVPSPTWAGVVADFRVSATETATAASFAAVDATLAAAVLNGSFATRVT